MNSSFDDSIRSAPDGLWTRVGRALGPGLITGSADDDPSGIATYSQVGAQFGFQLSWILLFSYPLMAVTQAIAGRIGCVTGRGIAQNLRRNYPRSLLRVVVLALLVANIANLGADLGAMGAAVQLLIGGPALAYSALLACLCIVLQIWLSYARYASILKWLTLSLFSYVIVVFMVDMPWGEALKSILIPSMSFDSAHVMALLAVLGTTISPYLFFWQASQEVEEQFRRSTLPLYVTPGDDTGEIDRVSIDTWVGMGLSNLISLFIVLAAAATLHAHGTTDIQTSAQAAEALRPIAGKSAFVVFALGIVGTGMLATPVLAGSAAYAVCETFGWVEGLDRKLKDARAFYGVIAVATLMGLGLNFLNVDPIKALYWSAVLNGVLAAPIMVAMLLIANNKAIMKEFVLSWPMTLAGWFAAAVMAVASLGFIVLSIIEP
ncbi:NRAMP family divalent metal transporter [Methylocella silvestris]|uniref:Iron transporter n=1 Tax=Methylocella silvestris TaxID=199596 RepID=A0A2J7TH93_METSI|nr:divalent metal cation transporter [Methylocella silvestris]PNG26140.1 iron transporter [Methylocella silvestris]